MLLPNQTVQLKFNGMHKKNKDHYANKGYEPIDGYFNVKVEDLPKTNKSLVKVICDYCNTKVIEWEYRKVLSEIKHCCKGCSQIKREEVFLKKYGVSNAYQLDKVKKTFIDKYGVENVGQIPKAKEKAKNTLFEKYGVTNAYQIESVRQTTLKNHGVLFPFQSETIREKQKQTMVEEYGVENPTQNEKILNRVFETNYERYGVKMPTQVEEFQQKATENMLKTMYENGTMQTSSQQKHLHNLLGGKLNYPISRTSLDIAFPEKMIYVEYNGGGHYAWPKFNGISDEEFHKKEMNRYAYLKTRDWKLIRIVCKSDKLYDDDKIKTLIIECKNYLNSDHSWIEIDMDNHKLICSEFTKNIEG